MTVVGVVGGGQLGRMLALAGVPLGVRCICVEPAEDPPAAAVAEVVKAAYGDRDALALLARRCDVITIEIEHVDVAALSELDPNLPLMPNLAAVRATQDRLAEKRALQAAGVATAAFAEPHEAPRGFPGGSIVKVRTGGYDGRGQLRVPPGGDVIAASRSLGAPAIVEQVVRFDRELSIVAARSTSGEVRCYPLVENRHADGILRETVAPAPGVTATLQAEAEALVSALLSSLDYVGVIAVELFDVDGHLVANEVAPRVHNSGHWTIEGARTSQFEQHLRAILGWPLGDPSPVGHAAMVNLIGHEPPMGALLAIDGAHVHRYGKAARPGRKLGHVTAVAPTESERDCLLDRVTDLVIS
ncbi:MAG TPA: 5-(carboxyamino)imidazole ribonucleotide synthase [Acidimicrobiales bacterium]